MSGSGAFDYYFCYIALSGFAFVVRLAKVYAHFFAVGGVRFSNFGMFLLSSVRTSEISPVFVCANLVGVMLEFYVKVYYVSVIPPG